MDTVGLYVLFSCTLWIGHTSDIKMPFKENYKLDVE